MPMGLYLPSLAKFCKDEGFKQHYVNPCNFQSNLPPQSKRAGTARPRQAPMPAATPGFACRRGLLHPLRPLPGSTAVFPQHGPAIARDQRRVESVAPHLSEPSRAAL